MMKPYSYASLYGALFFLLLALCDRCSARELSLYRIKIESSNPKPVNQASVPDDQTPKLTDASSNEDAHRREIEKLKEERRGMFFRNLQQGSLSMAGLGEAGFEEVTYNNQTSYEDIGMNSTNVTEAVNNTTMNNGTDFNATGSTNFNATGSTNFNATGSTIDLDKLLENQLEYDGQQPTSEEEPSSGSILQSATNSIKGIGSLVLNAVKNGLGPSNDPDVGAAGEQDTAEKQEKIAAATTALKNGLDSLKDSLFASTNGQDDGAAADGAGVEDSPLMRGLRRR